MEKERMTKKQLLAHYREELEIMDYKFDKVQALFSDISHYLEGTNLRFAECCKCAVAMAKVQRTRRPIKRRVIVLKEVIKELERPNSTVESALELERVKTKEMAGNILNFYRFRHLKDTRKKGFNVVKQTEEALRKLEMDEYEAMYEKEAELKSIIETTELRY